MNRKSLSFRVPEKTPLKKKQKEELDILAYATPLRSSNISRCGSVEVISDVELTSSESIQSVRLNLKRRRETPRRQKTLSTIAFRSPLISFDDYTENGLDQIEWLKCHATTSDGVLVISNGASYMIEHKLQLEAAQIREIRYKGRGIIKLTLQDYRKIILIRFRDRFERRQWLQSLDDQSRHVKRDEEYFYQPSPSKCKYAAAQRSNTMKIKSACPNLDLSDYQTPKRRRSGLHSIVTSALSKFKSKAVLKDLKKRVSLG